MAVFDVARTKMVENQLRANKVVDLRLTDAMRAVPRENFVPAALRGVAYADEDLLMAEGRWLMEPMLFGRLAQLAEIGPGDLVLDVGAGMGYGAAILAKLGSAVIALEVNATLAAGAVEALATLVDGSGDTVVVQNGPLQDGWTGQAPYDVIVCEGAIARRPDGLLDQLADGGRLVAMQVTSNGVQRGVVYQKRGGRVASRAVFDGATPVLPGFEAEPAFVF
jgi:protein-L-isoaspartate(D-aspartate) O-methyltransferase